MVYGTRAGIVARDAFQGVWVGASPSSIFAVHMFFNM